MVTATELRKISTAKRKENTQMQNAQRKDLEATLEALLKKEIPRTSKRVYRRLKADALQGEDETTFTICEYDTVQKDHLEVEAMKSIVERLQNRGLTVHYTSEQGYTGEGNNYQNYYTRHNWLVRW